MSTILDPKVTPFPSNKEPFQVVWGHFRQHWSKWLSVLALSVAVWSASTAHMAREQSRALAKLDFKPDVRIHSQFKEIAGFPPHLVLINRGPVEAIQVSVKMYSHRYFPDTGKVAATVASSGNGSFYNSIAPQDRKVLKFQKGWLERNARLQDPPQNNILEIQLQYRRAQDLDSIDASAFYFVNPNGIWVSEGDNSIRDSAYEKLKNAVREYRRETKGFVTPVYEDGDFLHLNIDP